MTGQSERVWGQQALDTPQGNGAELVQALHALDLMLQHAACLLSSLPWERADDEPELRERLAGLSWRREVFGREVAQLQTRGHPFSPQHARLLSVARHETEHLRREICRLGQGLYGTRRPEERH
ncbi:hypothetical protein [Deinococcus hopiensis]|uniref:Uncharacterized protein n=1 Tax=Deinococcus hopiensis KR-140 TaxID=695939 RepID=A0A1W1UFR5_9DEIO|nr:hypothetical protein [Deinococcus hopiensis]SMB79873.1 hypothetical protein SAMN00790413_05349 [Deinococcus hopiensis KR-140]